MYQKYFKRTIDITVSALLLFSLLPILMVVSVLIKVTSRGPLFFRQIRVGKDKEYFRVYKFRSMYINHGDKNRQTLPGDSSVTWIGQFLRRIKIDELPQLMNVLIGNMSLVGPRPCLPELLEEINEIGKARFLCRPGLTGLAQVNGNIYLDWQERWKFDSKYVKNITLLNDLLIILKTIFVVVIGEKKYLELMK